MITLTYQDSNYQFHQELAKTIPASNRADNQHQVRQSTLKQELPAFNKMKTLLHRTQFTNSHSPFLVHVNLNLAGTSPLQAAA